MPQRTNDFQRLVKLIEGQLAPEAAVVRESVLLQDAEGDAREIDVLIEAAVGPHKVSIAVECRDHKRKADKTWIEQLMGKYSGLPVHKVIAVSRSGFYAPAIEKARNNNITTLTLEEARDENWLNAIYRHDEAFVTTVKFVPVHVEVKVIRSAEAAPDSDEEFEAVYNSKGELIGRLPTCAFYLLHANFEATKILMDPLLRAFDTSRLSFKEDADVASMEIPLPPGSFLDPSGRYPIEAYRYRFVCKVERSSVKLERFSYNGAQIATGQVEALGAQLLVALISNRSEEPQIALSVNRKALNGEQQRLDAYSHPIPQDGPVHYLAFAFG